MWIKNINNNIKFDILNKFSHVDRPINFGDLTTINIRLTFRTLENLSTTNLNLVKVQAFLTELFKDKIKFKYIKPFIKKKHIKNKFTKKLVNNNNNKFSYFIGDIFSISSKMLVLQDILNKFCMIRNKLMLVKKLKKKN
jgi:hypothetical protein